MERAATMLAVEPVRTNQITYRHRLGWTGWVHTSIEEDNVCRYVSRARACGRRGVAMYSPPWTNAHCRCPQARRRFPSRVTVPSPPTGVTAPTKCGGRLCVPWFVGEEPGPVLYVSLKFNRHCQEPQSNTNCCLGAYFFTDKIARHFTVDILHLWM